MRIPIRLRRTERLAQDPAVRDWSVRSVEVKLIKIGGPLVRHARRLVFQLAEVAVPRELFQGSQEPLAQSLSKGCRGIFSGPIWLNSSCGSLLRQVPLAEPL